MALTITMLCLALWLVTVCAQTPPSISSSNGTIVLASASDVTFAVGTVNASVSSLVADVSAISSSLVMTKAHEVCSVASMSFFCCNTQMRFLIAVS